ncbi:MAG: glycoside hydrolase family 76 protein [Solirubrobacteraceae bacterium]
MQRAFLRRDGLYRRDGLARPPCAAAHLWPFARALVAMLDLAGVAPSLTRGAAFDAEAEIAARLRALERYRDPSSVAYASDVVGRRPRDDVYHDDNAWIGLALVQLERLRPGEGALVGASQLFRHALGGWDRRLDVPSPGGVFWLVQGRGKGVRNHDRNTVSTAPNAALGLHVAQLAPAARATAPVGPSQMCEWVHATMRAQDGLFWDKLRGDGTVDRTVWSYNQGSMVGLHVLLARAQDRRAGTAYIERAQAIAYAVLARWAGRWESQPAAFNAICFRNLLLLHHASEDERLRGEIVSALRGYADLLWERRDARGLVSTGRWGAATLLDQSGLVQVLALLAWDPARWKLLA